MIVVKLIGGLGNQMFQYAAGRSLALRNNTELFLDLTSLNADPQGKFTKRCFELDRFQIKAQIADQKILAFFNEGKSGRIGRIFQRTFPFLNRKNIFVESGHAFHSTFNQLRGDVYLTGFWQSEKYFAGYSEQIKNDFKLKEEPADEIKIWLERIAKVNSISVHVRRGDYISLTEAGKFHGVCSPSYYENAVKFIAATNPGAELFIFSDDIAWCRQTMNFDLPLHFVSTSQHAVWDLFLMSKSKHNITANSSFSWWAAWLNSNINKVVVTPSPWFDEKSIDTSDMMPQNWVRMPK